MPACFCAIHPIPDSRGWGQIKLVRRSSIFVRLDFWALPLSMFLSVLFILEARANPGDPDNSFGVDGKVLTDFESGGADASDLVV